MLHMLPGSILLPPCGGIDKAPLRLHPKLLNTLSDLLPGPDALQSQLTGARDSVIPRRKISEPSNFKLKLKGIFFSDIALFALEDIFSACQVSQNYQQALAPGPAYFLTHLGGPGFGNPLGQPGQAAMGRNEDIPCWFPIKGC